MIFRVVSGTLSPNSVEMVFFFSAYVSLEASEEASKSYLRAGQVKK